MTSQNDPKQASAHDVINQALPVVENVVNETFLWKMAQLGHSIETPEQRERLLRLGGKVASLMAQRNQQPAQKQASDLDEFEQQLDAFLGKEASEPPITEEAEQLALHFLQNPAVYGATRTLKTADALSYVEQDA